MPIDNKHANVLQNQLHAFAWTFWDSPTEGQECHWGNPIQRYIICSALPENSKYEEAKSLTPSLVEWKYTAVIVCYQQGMEMADSTKGISFSMV